MIGISGSLTWSKTLMGQIFLTPVLNFGKVRRAQLAKSTLLTSLLGPWDILRSFKVCSDAKERVGCGKQRKLPHLFIPSKTPNFVPEFDVEDMPLGENTLMMMVYVYIGWKGN